MKKELDELKIYQNMSKIDKMKATYHKPPQKWYLEKRMDAFNIIQEFGVHYRLSRQTIYESFLYADKILAYINEIDPKEFELNLIVCSLIGSKFVENDTIEINYNELITFSKNYNYTIDEIYLTEISILQKLNYYLSFPSIYEFIQYLNIIGVFFRSEILDPKSVSEDIQNITLKVITSPITLKYPNEVIAMNIIRTIRKKYNLKEEFMKKILRKFEFEYDKLYEKCFDEINLLIFGEVKQEKIEKKESKKQRPKLISFESDEIKNENKEEDNSNIDIQRRKAQAKTTKRPRGSIKFEVPKEYIKNVQIMQWSSSSSSSSLSSSFDSSSNSNSNNSNSIHISDKEEKEEKKKSPPKKVIKSKMKKEGNKEKKKKLIVHINENKNQYFEENLTSLKLSSNNINIQREKQRRIKPVNKDKINFPFSGKRVATITYSPEEERSENGVNVEPRKFKSVKGFKTPKMKKIK